MAEVRVFSGIDARALLGHLRDVDRNFDPSDLPVRAGRGWHVDRYRREIAFEPPGEPLPCGPWEAARDLSAGYRFVDPSIVRAFYDPGEPLDGRTLLLEVHFAGLRIYVGVRVSASYDVRQGVDDAEERVSGWSYDTLQGHFERGRIAYEVSKRLDTGHVEFRIDARSRRGNPGNLVVAAGFVVFGRFKQREFGRAACERMASFTDAAPPEERAARYLRRGS